MNAIETAFYSPYYCEARAYCDRHDLDPEAVQKVIFSLAYKDFMEMSEPLRRLKAKYVSLYPKNTYVRADTGELVPWEMPPDLIRSLEQIDEAISGMAEKFGLKAEKAAHP